MQSLRTWSARGARLLLLTAMVVAASGCASTKDIVEVGVWLAAIQMAAFGLLAASCATIASMSGGRRR